MRGRTARRRTPTATRRPTSTPGTRTLTTSSSRTELGLELPAREIPIPTSVSPEAQAVLAMPALPAPERPPVGDLDAWRTMIREHDASIDELMSARTADAPVAVEERDVGGVRVYDLVPDDFAADDRRVFLEI